MSYVGGETGSTCDSQKMPHRLFSSIEDLLLIFFHGLKLDQILSEPKAKKEEKPSYPIAPNTALIWARSLSQQPITLFLVLKVKKIKIKIKERKKENASFSLKKGKTLWDFWGYHELPLLPFSFAKSFLRVIHSYPVAQNQVFPLLSLSPSLSVLTLA